MSPVRHRPYPVAGRGQLRTLSWDFAADDRVPPHFHDWHQLIYGASGVMSIHTAAGTWVIPPNRAVWVPAGVEHSIDMSGPVSMRTIYLSRPFGRSLPRECRVLSVSPLLRELLLHAAAMGGLERRVPAQRRLMDVLIDALRPMAAVDALHLPMPRDARASQVARRLVEKPDDARTLAALARAAGGSKRTIERAFKAGTGMTFVRWRQQLRLIESLRLLAAGRPVTSVALDVGYGSASAFVEVFRTVFGVTPGRYYRTEPRAGRSSRERAAEQRRDERAQ